jgi:hypothetical protein
VNALTVAAETKAELNSARIIFSMATTRFQFAHSNRPRLPTGFAK